MSKTRVLQVFASLDMGGAECRMMDIYRAIDRSKIDFDFVTLQLGKQYFENEISKFSCKVIKIHSPRDIGILKHIKELRKCIREGQYDAIHAHTSYHCGLVMLAAYLEKVPIRITHARTNGSIQKSFLTKLYIGFGRILINRFSTHKLAISKESGKFVFGKSKFKVIPNSIVLDKYIHISAEEISELKRELKINASCFVVGHIGRFDRFKNQRFVIDVFSELIKSRPNSKLVLVGDGELKSDLEVYVQELKIDDKVIFTGVRNDVPKLINSFDVLLFPSIVEGLGGVVLEAQAANIPSVVSENIPNEVDLKLGLIKKLDLISPVDDWVDALIGNFTLSNTDDIKNSFEQRGYTISYAVNYYSKIYQGINDEV